MQKDAYYSLWHEDRSRSKNKSPSFILVMSPAPKEKRNLKTKSCIALSSDVVPFSHTSIFFPISKHSQKPLTIFSPYYNMIVYSPFWVESSVDSSTCVTFWKGYSNWLPSHMRMYNPSLRNNYHIQDLEYFTQSKLF